MATLTVPTQFATIADALGRAAPGDVVVVDASYPGNETATVTVENVTVTAPASVRGIDLILGAGIVGVTLGGGAAIDVTGNGLGNSIVGNSGGNVLDGGGGQDRYYGLAGNDTLVGGGGADLDIADYSLDARNGGGSGIVANQSAGRVQGGVDPDTVIDGFGNTDSIVGIRNIVGTNFADRIYGGGNANVLVGLGGDDRIEGGGGADRLNGGAGNDTLLGGSGLDTAIYSGSSPALAAFRQSYDLSGNLATGGSVTGTGVAATASGTDAVAGIERFAFVDGTVEADVTSATAQAYRIYDAAFGRAPDAQGFNFFVDALDNGLGTTALAGAFAASGEFQANYGALSNRAYVEALYQNALGRAGDAEGTAFWTNALDSGRLSRDDVLAGFSESAEHVELLRPVAEAGLFNVDATAAQVARLYESAFDRVADADGLRFFTDAVKSGAQAAGTVADAFAASGEFGARFGTLANGQFVEQLYQNTFGRAGDAPGAAFWTNALDTGTFDRGDVLLGFAESAESRALTAPGQDGILVA